MDNFEKLMRAIGVLYSWAASEEDSGGISQEWAEGFVSALDSITRMMQDTPDTDGQEPL